MEELRKELEEAFQSFKLEIDNNFREYGQYTIDLFNKIYEEIVNDEPDSIVFGCLFSRWHQIKNILEICKEDIIDYGFLTDMVMVLEDIIKRFNAETLKLK